MDSKSTCMCVCVCVCVCVWIWVGDLYIYSSAGLFCIK